MKAMSEFCSLEKSLKCDLYLLKLDLGYFMQKFSRLVLELDLYFSTQLNSQYKFYGSPPKSVVMSLKENRSITTVRCDLAIATHGKKQNA